MVCIPERNIYVAFAIDSYGPISAGHAHESCWSNPMQMTGPVECKWVGKSVQLPSSAMIAVIFAAWPDRGRQRWTARNKKARTRRASWG